ncbi:hypothetical protein MtrunA17_Chr3g0095621 [Medicago truncatula]|uniref:Transmembrane protein n=1 Tax=Medicago truncatula TaxID=3880 RepID=A0A396IS86_MEDTR|nr:hypothetical protein MtrunA17_Chr3g0095621 [Medicago truncatula]
MLSLFVVSFLFVSTVVACVSHTTVAGGGFECGGVKGVGSILFKVSLNALVVHCYVLWFAIFVFCLGSRVEVI